MTKVIMVQEDYNRGKLPEMWVDIYQARATVNHSAVKDAHYYLQETIEISERRFRKFRIVEITQEVIHECSINEVTNG